MFDILLDVFIDAVLDTLKLVPFLFLTYLLMEWLEHKTSDAIQRKVKRAGRLGPLFGGLLGAVPQCGFSAAASGLYAGKIISMGTLIAIYLSTSDEMLPILISENVGISFIVMVLALKVIYGCLIGFVLDLLFKKETKMRADSRPDEPVFTDLCKKENCNCEESVLFSALKHTLQIVLFIFIINIILGCLLAFVPESFFEGWILNNSFLGPFVSAFIGLIPNCAASVVITQMFLKGAMSFGSMMAGLLCGAGIGWIVLLRAGHNKRDTLKVIGILYLTSVLGGLLMGLLL